MAWIFGKSMGKTIIVREQTASDRKPPDDGVTAQDYEGHSLRLYDGYAQRCLSPCGEADLRKGDSCDMIQRYNETSEDRTSRGGD